MDISKILSILDELEKGITDIRAELAQIQNNETGIANLAKLEEGIEKNLQLQTQEGQNSIPDKEVEYYKPQVLEFIGEKNPVEEVMGGKIIKNFPDCCAVGQESNYYCSGTLIHPRIVVTARHCRQITHVFAGWHDVLESHKGQTIPVAKKYFHTNQFIDLQILVLTKAVQRISPRSIAPESKIGNPTEAFVAGFGYVHPIEDKRHGVKRLAKVPIQTIDCADRTRARDLGCRVDVEIVAGHLGLRMDEKGTCEGDSGGPLYIKDPSRNNYYLLGVTSRATKGRKVGKCGDGCIYSRVDLHLDWIRDVTGISIEDSWL